MKRQPNKLHRRERSYSFERGAEDALAVERRRTGASGQRRSGAVLHGSVDPGTHAHSQNTKDFGPPNAQYSESGNNHFPRMPTLHNKRNAEHTAHKKSSKRRKADHAREEEVRAMSTRDPIRKAAQPWQSGRPMKRDSRRVVTGLGLGFRRSFDKERPHSDISLPLPGSIHSSLSSDSEQVAFKVSALEVLAPRPTLRYTVHPRRYSPPPARPDRLVSVRHKLSANGSIPEATLKAHKRIDELADDLTARDLRELMERDGRRRAKKQEQDRARLERRLARRAEKDRLAQREGRDAPPNLERGVLGRERIGLGIEPESAVVTSSTPRASPTSSQNASPDRSSKQSGKRPAEEMDDDDEHTEQAAQGPLGHFHRTDSVPLDNTSMVSEPEELPVPRTRSPRKRIMLMPRSSRSRSPPPPPPPPTEPPKLDNSATRKKSEGSIKRLRRSWSNLFRWGSRKRKAGPSSFSNTSRDSVPGNNVPQFAPIPPELSRKLSSNVPKRTLSRFREDLPELPVSPPQSREGSPELEQYPSVIVEQDSPEPDTKMGLDDTVPNRRDTPMSPEEAPGGIPASVPTSLDPSPEPAPVALGSVDSEGSWFGKKTSVRRSNPTPLSPPRHERKRPTSINSFDSHHDPDLPTEEIADDNGSLFADEDYLSAGLAHQRSSGSHVSHARASSDMADDARWGVVGGRTPNVVEQHASFIKSHEGLLHVFSDDSYGSERGEVENPLVANEQDKENAPRRVDNTNRHSKGKRRSHAPRSSVDTWRG